MSNDDETYPCCAICKKIYIRPRMFPVCGHSLCEPCMKSWDEQTEPVNAYTAIAYKCPICRTETLAPWMRRPINRALDETCRRYEEYSKREEECPATEPSNMKTGRDVNLAQMAATERERIAENLYEEIFPLLYKAAVDGSDFISITSPEKVHAIYRVGDILTDRLFKHKIYRVVVAPDEVTIYILKRPITNRNEFLNVNYEAPGISGVTNEFQNTLTDISSTIHSLTPTSPRLSRIELGSLRLPLRTTSLATTTGIRRRRFLENPSTTPVVDDDAYA